MSRKCIGCGVVLQSDNENLPGYVPIEKSDAKYCMRCFKIKHYNEKIVVDLKNVNDSVLNEISKKDGYKFFLVDFLNINSETMNMFKKINGLKMLLISKMDIIPKSIKKEMIVNYIRDIYGIENDIDFISSKKKYNTGIIYKTLCDKGIKDGYVLGYTNSGKSNLINELCLKMDMEGSITTSSLPNTTLDYIKIVIDDKVIYDTPGFVLNKNYYSLDDSLLIDMINPRNVINPLTYQMKTDTRIVLNNKTSFKSDIENSFTFYMSNSLKIDKYFKDIILDDDYILDLDNDSDIVIKGIGFINVKKKCKVFVRGIDRDLLEVRKSMFGDNNE